MVRYMLPRGKAARATRTVSSWQLFRLSPSSRLLLEKSEQCGIDLLSALLLYPVATIGQNLCLDRRHPEPHLLDPHVWADQFKNGISSTTQKKGGLRDPGIDIGSQQFPVSIRIPIPVESAGKARAGELLAIVRQIDFRQPGRQRRGE